jgi:hypothetical protein
MKNVYKMCIDLECSKTVSLSRSDIEDYFNSFAWI